MEEYKDVYRDAIRKALGAEVDSITLWCLHMDISTSQKGGLAKFGLFQINKKDLDYIFNWFCDKTKRKYPLNDGQRLHAYCLMIDYLDLRTEIQLEKQGVCNERMYN